jgi:hypothetical protein
MRGMKTQTSRETVPGCLAEVPPIAAGIYDGVRLSGLSDFRSVWEKTSQGRKR